MNPPRLTIIAGANGSGKTTLTHWNSDVFRSIPVLDPDAIGKTFQSTLPSTFPVEAARRVLSSARKHIQNRRSFAVETTLSGKGYLRMMLEARQRGFEIVLVYIGTENVEINLSRIRDRVLAGGHNVPENDVRRRYRRSFDNLPTAVERADHTILFDNSTVDGYRLVAVLASPISHSMVNHWLVPTPQWAALIVRKFPST
ncbi:MAG TPA: zeta toxin family protein [Candidatus Sulfotelmatobacter sp.]|nr:zeta toxin family protein [Candidatus Sulfotelmatobacter sp.]